MEADRTEMHDLAAKSRSESRRWAKYEAWAERAQVLPWIWTPAYRAKE